MRINKKTEDDIKVQAEKPLTDESAIDTETARETEIEEVAEITPVIDEIDDTPIAILGTTITQKQLNIMKEKYGKKNIFKTTFLDDTFVWHKLNRASFSKVISDTRSIEDKEEQTTKCEQEFVRAAVLWPEITEEFLIEEDVMVSGLSEEILYRSGFVPAQTERV